MREIKFRIWDGTEMSHEDLGAFVSIDEMKISPIHCELMQFTNMKDKNGVEIYEHDILRGINSNPFSNEEVREYLVIWGVDHWHIKGTLFSLQELFNFCNTNIEVIGNKYENPELLRC